MRKKATEDMPPISVTRAEAKNWADMGNKLVGTNTRNKKIVEAPVGAVFNQRGDRFFQTKAPMMQDSPSTGMPRSGKGVGASKMAKSDMKDKAMRDARAWSDASPRMARVNAKTPMVVEQHPSGDIMGRLTSAKAGKSKGSAATKMAKGQGAYINGKPASTDLTKAMRPRKKG